MGILDLHTHQLNSFLVTAESRSFSEAAERLFISHTALIQQMNALEKELGFSLFIRSPRGIRLTESGKTFYDGFQELVSQSDSLISKCKTMDESARIVRVGNMNDLHTFYFYADFYRQFQKDNPEITLDFFPTLYKNVLSLCENNEIDVGFYFGMEKQAEHPSLIFRTAAIPNMSIAVSKDNPLAKKERITAADLKDRKVYASNISDEALIYHLIEAIENGKLELFDASMQSVYEICRRGELFVLPIWFAQQFPKLCFLPFDPPVPFAYQVVYRKEHSVAAQRLVNAYLEYDAAL